MMTIVVRAGMTEPLDFQLLGKDPVTNITAPVNLTGTVALELHTRDELGNIVVYTMASGKLSITDLVNGKVRFQPLSTDLVAAQRAYECWFQQTDGSNNTISYPSDSNFAMTVIAKF